MLQSRRSKAEKMADDNSQGREVDSNDSDSEVLEESRNKRVGESSDDEDFQVKRRSGGRALRRSTRLQKDKKIENKISSDEEESHESEENQLRRSSRTKRKPVGAYAVSMDLSQFEESSSKRRKRDGNQQSRRNKRIQDSYLYSEDEFTTSGCEPRRSERPARTRTKPKYVFDITDSDPDEDAETEVKESEGSNKRRKSKDADDDEDYMSTESEESRSSIYVPPYVRTKGARTKTGKGKPKAVRAVDTHQDYCRVCKDGGDLLCCDECPWAYHMECLNPPLTTIPKGKWSCPRCSAEPIDGVADQILAWRWKEPKSQREAYWKLSGAERKKCARPTREFFVHLAGKSYWKCIWVGENRLKVYHPTLLRKYLENEELEDVPTAEVEDYSSDHRKWETPEEEKYFQYGVQPEWLQVHRVINHRQGEKEGPASYLVKWRELGYDRLSWENEDEPVPGLREAIAIYKERRKLYEGAPAKKLKLIFVPPEKPIINPKEKYEGQPAGVVDTEKGLALHQYQLDGLNWLRFSWAEGTNTILADEMGLGKTIQAITFLSSLYKEGHCRGPFLVTAPLSTLINWEREFELWAPELYVVTYSGFQDARQVIRDNELSFDENAILSRRKAVKLRGSVRFQVLLTSYESISRDQVCLGSIKWEAIVVDEAHRIKNDFSLFYRCLRNYETKYRLLLTGTPLQNNLEELFYLLHFLCPDKFDDLENFQEEFADISKEEQVQKLHEMLAPHMLRRLKTDVLTLPSKSEVIVRVGLSPMQRKYYKFILTKNVTALNATVGHKTSLLNILMDLRKCCNHPYLFSTAEEEAPKNEDGSFELQALVKACGKLILLEKMLKHLKENGHRVLIFSQMTRVLDLLEEFLIGLEYQYERIDGSIRGTLRQEAIDRFNRPRAKQFVFLLSTKAGGLGINLATADTVIIYDSDWNPHNDIQAFSRAHRIGQKNKVMIYRFVTKDSVEEKMVQVANRKLLLTHLVVRPENVNSLTKEELSEVIKFGTKNLFNDNSHDSSNNYSDENIAQLLDRGNKGIEQKESWFNEYLKSFKVASYVTGEEPAADDAQPDGVKAEGAADDKENQDPHYWVRLLQPHMKDSHEEIGKSYGRGKRLRKEVKYVVDQVEDPKEKESQNIKEDSDFEAEVVIPTDEGEPFSSTDDDNEANDDIKAEPKMKTFLQVAQAITAAASPPEEPPHPLSVSNNL